jgi:hypothetical protein
MKTKKKTTVDPNTILREYHGDFLLLKWGSLKGWRMEHNKRAKKYLQQYMEDGVSMSAMLQKDTDRQTNLILKIIDTFRGPITNDWSGRQYRKKTSAKKYITDYAKEKLKLNDNE